MKLAGLVFSSGRAGKDQGKLRALPVPKAAPGALNPRIDGVFWNPPQSLAEQTGVCLSPSIFFFSFSKNMVLAKEGTEHEKPLCPCGKKKSSWWLGRDSGQENQDLTLDVSSLRGKFCTKSLWNSETEKLKLLSCVQGGSRGGRGTHEKKPKNNPKKTSFSRYFIKWRHDSCSRGSFLGCLGRISSSGCRSSIPKGLLPEDTAAPRICGHEK